MPGRAREVREVRLTPEPGAARIARHAVGEVLAEEGLSRRVYDAELAVSEIVTNAVLHGREPITLRLFVTGTGVRVEVHDGSPVSPAFSMLDPTAVTGRGLLLVSAVSDGWGVDPDDHGKTVWFVLDRVRPDPAEAEETERLLASWADGLDEDPARERVRVVLTDVDAHELAESEAHSEGLLRELTLVGEDSPHHDKAAAIIRATAPLDALRLDVRHQVALALHVRRRTLDVTVTIRREDAEQVRDFMYALEDADRLSRLGELLLVPTPAETSAFRTAFLSRLLDQLRS
jgi:anti-sigma regulatory factor (Ser/Thr protein kinase)